MELETLYKSTKTGAVQVCKIFVEGDVFIVEYGQLEGKMQRKSTTCFPKNLGRSNETSSEEQAIIEAKSKWAKKTKEGYSISIEAPTTVQLPQKVKSYLEYKDKVTFPAYSTEKFNGINATYWLVDGVLSLTSRGGNKYPDIPHLEEFVREAMTIAGTNCLNGELYIHGEHLQDITSAVKKPKELSKKLRFRVFELPLVYKPYKEKVDILSKIPEAVTPTKVHSHEEIENHYLEVVGKGFEGTVLYNLDSVYRFNERSSSVYKYKKVIDAEFKVLDYNLDKNGHPVYLCEVSSGGTFKVKRKGTAEERTLDSSIADTNKGKWLNVEYEMLSKTGIPLKPVGNGFRACNPNGDPME